MYACHIVLCRYRCSAPPTELSNQLKTGHIVSSCRYFAGKGNPAASNQRRSGITTECFCIRYGEKREGQITPRGTGKQTYTVVTVESSAVSTHVAACSVHFF